MVRAVVNSGRKEIRRDTVPTKNDGKGYGPGGSLRPATREIPMHPRMRTRFPRHLCASDRWSGAMAQAKGPTGHRLALLT